MSIVSLSWNAPDSNNSKKTHNSKGCSSGGSNIIRIMITRVDTT